MGRFFLFLGIILMVVGFAAPMLGMGNLFNSLQPTLDLATNSDVQEDELCEEGETLEQEEGSSTYTPGTGYGRSVTFYCVDSEGNRRDVTMDFVEGLFDGGGMFSNVFSFIGQTVLFACLGVVGIFLTIIGAFMSRGKAKNSIGFGMPDSYVSSSMPMNTGSSYPASTFGSAPTTPTANQGLSKKLQDLETAYRQNLINREEYESARQKILDSMGDE